MNEYGFSQGIARNASQSEYPNLWRGLVGLWSPAAGVQGNRLVDFSGNGRHGTLTNGPVWTPTSRRTGLLLDATNDYVDLGAAVLLTAGEPFSITWWERVTSDATAFPSRFCLDMAGTTNYFLCLRSKNAGYATLSWGRSPAASGSSMRAAGMPTLPDSIGRWNFFCIVGRDPNSASAADYASYCNGQSFSVTTGDGFSAVTTNRFGHDGADSPSNATFGEIRIYRRILSLAEIMQSYMGASPLVRAVQTYGKSVSAALPRKTRMLFA